MSISRFILAISLLLGQCACWGGSGDDSGKAGGPRSDEEKGKPFCELAAGKTPSGNFQITLRAGNFRGFLGVAFLNDTVSDQSINLVSGGATRTRSGGPLFTGTTTFDSPPPNTSRTVTARIPNTPREIICTTTISGNAPTPIAGTPIPAPFLPPTGELIPRPNPVVVESSSTSAHFFPNPPAVDP